MTYASWADTLGRYIAGKKDFFGKSKVLPVCLVRGIFFTVMYMMTFEGVASVFFGSQWFVIVMLFWFALSCGYLSTVGMKFGSDSETKN